MKYVSRGRPRRAWIITRKIVHRHRKIHSRREPLEKNSKTKQMREKTKTKQRQTNMQTKRRNRDRRFTGSAEHPAWPESNNLGVIVRARARVC